MNFSLWGGGEIFGTLRGGFILWVRVCLKEVIEFFYCYNNVYYYYNIRSWD